MKKIYYKPETKIVEVQLAQIIAGSLQGMAADGGDVQVIDENATGAGMSRRSVWDEEGENY